MPTLADNIRTHHPRGWHFIPLNGKVPTLKAWTTAPRASLAEALAYAAEGNVGLRTGLVSGVVVVDVDTDDCELEFDAPCVRTGSGGRHYYYASPPAGLRNSVRKLAPGVDIRADGGQVVFPGSVHPETGELYTWIREPESDLPELPQWILDRLAEPAGPTGPPPKISTRYGDTALSRECEIVARAPEGERNRTLYTAALKVGSLVRSGDIPESYAVHSLTTAAKQAGLDDHEIRQTIKSGFDRAHPRIKQPKPARRQGYVLVPGSYHDENGNYLEIGTDDFARDAVTSLPDGSAYRRGGEAVRLLGEPGEMYCETITLDQMRTLLDSSMRLAAWKPTKGDDGEETNAIVFRYATKDLAGLIAGEAAASDILPQIEAIVHYPVFLEDWRLAEPGWNGGIYYDAPSELHGLVPEKDVDVILSFLEDLIVDFPFRDEASRENMYGLLLTPLIRPALYGNTPFHLVQSSLERTGKSKLAADVLGGIILGTPTPALQLTSRDEEIDKRILSLLMRGDTVVHLDNLPPYIDSPSLASLLTTRFYQGRVLGSTRIVSLPNYITVVGTGNNTQLTPELAKRTVPIVLQPYDADPESRSNFRHPDLREYVIGNRKRILECLIGAVLLWREAGMPKQRYRMGGFEAWSEAIGGILYMIGYRSWRVNIDEWRRDADPESVDMDTFVEAWNERHGRDRVSGTELTKLARDIDVFRDILTGANGPAISFGMRVLSRLVNRPVGRWIVRRTGSGKRMYWLEPQ